MRAVTLLASIAGDAARQHGDRPALLMPGGWSLSFADADRLSDEVAAGWQSRGMAEGDVVVLLVPSGPEYLVAYLAAAKIGAIAAGVNPMLGDTERRRLVERCRSRWIVASSPDDAALHGADASAEVIVAGTASDVGELLRDQRSPGGSVDSPPSDPSRPVAIVFTSGTTGMPKGATFTERQFRATLDAERSDPWSAGQHIISGTQFAHVGFMLRMHAYLDLGTSLCLMARWRALDALRLIERHRMPVINGVSAQIALMLQVPELDAMDLSCVSRIVTGGGPSTPDLVDRATKRFDSPYTSRYSLTEAGGLGTATGLDSTDDERYHSVGTPRGGIELRLDGAERVGDVGEICLRGPSVMAGYWDDPEATAEALVDGWLHTGDLGRLDDRGVLRLAGRSKEMYVRGGYNVYPQEVEAVLNAHPSVTSVVVVPRTDPVMGEIGVAVVVPRPGAAPVTLDDLRTFAATRLARFKLPEDLRLVDAFPVTAMQKVDRHALADVVVSPSPGGETPTSIR